MKLEYNDQSQKQLLTTTKQCQICDSPMREVESYCHRCGALWCESDDKLDEKVILLFDPQDFTQLSVMPSCVPPAGYSGFSFA
jgi:hypothetical protein